jgi:hypothetical protein
MKRGGRKLLLTFVLAVLVGVIGAVVTRPNYSCSIDCPRTYPTNLDKCEDCCDECCQKKYPDAFGICTDECYTMC